ncbi:reverse transcriptase domain-containing protein [Tanacetum coccineum]
MDGINIDDLTIEQYLRLTQENQTPSMVKKVDDMTIAEYIEYEERMKRQYNRNYGSYFPTYSGHCTSSNNTTIEFPRNAYFNPIQPNTEFNYDSDKWKLDKSWLSSEEDLDEWLKAEMEKHMSKQNEKNEEDALIAIITSIREEYTVNNDSFTSNFPYQPSLEELNLGSFLLPFTIDNYNSYAMANIDVSNNVMPRSIYEYLKLANLGRATTSVEMDDMTQQETLGTVKNVLVKIDKFEFPCDFVVTNMPENLRELIILGRPFLKTIHAQIDVFQEEISLGIGEDRIKFDVNGNPRQLTTGPSTTLSLTIPMLKTITDTAYTPLTMGHKHSKLEEKAQTSESSKLRPFRPRPYDYSFDEWLKVKIGHIDIYNSDREIVFNEWILDSFDVEEAYAKEIGNPYS